MGRPIRQFMARRGERPDPKVAEVDDWITDARGQAFTDNFRAFKGGVPNNPQNARSFVADGEQHQLVRRNPYGDGEQRVAPETPVITRANQWAGRSDADTPNVDPRAEEPQRGPGFGFGSQSPLNRVPMADGTSYAAPIAGAPAPRRGQRGTDFGSGKRNSPKPNA